MLTRIPQATRGYHNIPFSGAPCVGRFDLVTASLAPAKHTSHILDAVQVPLADVLVDHERISAIHEIVHIFDVTRAPLTDVLVEVLGVSEHRAHSRHAGGVPVADVGVEIDRIFEYLRHISDPARAPRADFSVFLFSLFPIIPPHRHRRTKAIVVQCVLVHAAFRIFALRVRVSVLPKRPSAPQGLIEPYCIFEPMSARRS